MKQNEPISLAKLKKADLINKLKNELENNGLPVFVYGAGFFAAELESFFHKNKISITGFFVDERYKKGFHQVKGPVYSKNKLLKTFSAFLTVIGLSLDPFYVKNSLRKIGIFQRGPVYNIDCRFWRKFKCLKNSWIEKNALKLQKTKSLFKDKLSQKTFDEIIRTKITHNPDGLYNLIRYPQYFPADLQEFYPTASDTVVDVGAFTGDTLSEYINLVPSGRCQSYHAFEADTKNAKKLLLYGQKNHLDFLNVYQVALGNINGKVRFQAYGNSCSKVNEFAGLEVGARKLDSFKLKPTFIKMDIEGFEAHALRGAEKTIVQNLPRLAIAVYHSLSDLLSIPEIIQKFNPNYRLYLRIHRYYSEEYIIYAVV